MQKKNKCTPEKLLVHPNPPTGPDPLNNNNDNNNNKKNPRNPPPESKPPETLQKASRPVDPLTFIVFFLHDIVRTDEIHAKTMQMHPRKASGAPRSTHRTRPSNNNNNNNKKNPRNPPPAFKASKTLQKA